MDYDAVLAQALTLLQQEQRLAYRVLKLRFQLDDDTLEALKDDLIYAKQLAVDEDGRVLVWTGGPARVPPTASPVPPSATLAVAPPQGEAFPALPLPPEAERRQLTVLFCDLVDSTALSSQLDPEELREVVRAYQDTCAKVIARFDGHIEQYLGDGLLVYFGYPLAHEDDAQRAVRAGLGMVEAMGQLNTHVAREHRVQLAVRLGIHTGLVVVGEVGGGTRQEQLALGETPNLAARLQGIAAPNTLVISATTFQLLGGFFACQPLGTPPLKGLAQPLAVYRVLYESMARSRLEAVGSTGWTPLVGREQEIGLLQARWAQVKEGLGQVVLLSGEAGIGKSRLVQVLTEHVAAEPQAWLTPCQCSPYYQNTALYPLIELLERVALRFEREESPPQKLRKLEGFVVQYGLPLAETVPLFAALLSLLLPLDYAPLTMSPEQQKQQTLHALLTILLRIAAQQPVLFVMEDLHWVDPTTLELLSLLVDQGTTTRILALFTFRPDFSPPWTGRAHLTQVTVHRLPRHQAVEVIRQVAHGKVLPPEVVEQVVAKTDGVPLFVEEMTKAILESGHLKETDGHVALTRSFSTFTIPATLQDSLMARLDRLVTAKAVAQYAAVIGRQFSYGLLQAVSQVDEVMLQHELGRLVEAEIVYQRGVPPLATYVFKHALIQEAAYESLLKSTRQRYHQRITQVLEEQFPETTETHPELLAHHYTEAGLTAQAVSYWQRAGHNAIQRSANVEAIAHLTKGVEQLHLLPDTADRVLHELTLHRLLGVPLLATKGWAAPEVGQVYARAHALCQRVGDLEQIYPVLVGLWSFYLVKGELQTAQALAEELLTIAQRQQDSALLSVGYFTLGDTLYWRGALVPARTALEQGLVLYAPQQHRDHAVRYGQDPGTSCLGYAACTLWLLGYPEQARRRSQEMLTRAQVLTHTFSLAFAHNLAIRLYGFLREWHTVLEQAERLMALASEQGFAQLFAACVREQGAAWAAQGQVAQGLTQMRQALTYYRTTGAVIGVPHHLAQLAEACGHAGEVEEGVRTLTEALAVIETTGERVYEAELYRLKGELLLRRAADYAPEAETCFHQALSVACSQQAKAWELRAAISLARLWQQEGNHNAARQVLGDVYGWFTEGFDTADLQEAKTLLDALA